MYLLEGNIALFILKFYLRDSLLYSLITLEINHWVIAEKIHL